MLNWLRAVLYYFIDYFSLESIVEKIEDQLNFESWNESAIDGVSTNIFYLGNFNCSFSLAILKKSF